MKLEPQANGGLMKNPLVKLFGALVLAAVLILAVKDMIIAASITHLCHKTTGLHLNIGHFKSSLLRSDVEIKDLKLYNPSGYSEKIMFSIPEVYVKYDLGSFFSGKPHLQEVRLHLAELEVEKNKEGKLNLAELKPAGGKKPADSKPSNAPTVSIDLLKLQIDKVTYKDFSKPIPFNQDFFLNIDKTYNNIKDVKALVPIIISDALTSQALRSLVNFNVSDLLQNFQAGGINVADLGLDKISGAFNSGLGQTAQGVVGSVADQIGSIFGSGKKK